MKAIFDKILDIVLSPLSINIDSFGDMYNDFNAVEAIMAIFGGEIPRVIQGVKL